MAGSKCKPGQGQWALKLESCYDVITTLFSTAMAGQGSVANWYIYIPDFTNLVYFLDRLVGEIMVWYMSLNLV